jgi:hypothetical protein
MISIYTDLEKQENVLDEKIYKKNEWVSMSKKYGYATFL